MMKSLCRVNVLFSIAILSSTSLSYAQLTPAGVPGSAQSERVGERYKLIERPAVGVGAVIENADEKGKVKIASGEKFTLKSVKFEGASNISDETLQAQVASYSGQKVSLADLHAMTSKVTTHLRNEGYILSRAVLPPQTIDKNGAVKVRIIEGFADTVILTGDTKSQDSVLQNMAAKIRNSKPLKASDLERYLLLMEDLPGVSARATIQPSATTVGASDVVINITQKPLDLAITTDNRGSRFLGPFQASVSAAFNNVVGLHERTQFRYVSSVLDEELRYGEIVHEEQIGSEGTKGVISASLTDATPGYTLQTLDVESQTRTFSAAVRHPFLRSRQTNLYGIIEAVVRDTDTTTLDNRLYNDRTRTLKATSSYDFVDKWQAVNKTDFSLTKGFGIFDDDPAGGIRSRVDGETNFTKVNASASRLQPISGPFSLLASASGQYSFNPLLASEEFGMGGEDFLSAYDASEATGDHGLAAKIELQYNKFETMKWLQYYQLYAYYDAGKVWNKGNIAVDDSIPLTSTGIGVRFNMLDSISGSLDFALPINRPVTANGLDGDAPRVFFSLAYRY
jgi:hemolysin activation/secretion protein